MRVKDMTQRMRDIFFCIAEAPDGVTTNDIMDKLGIERMTSWDRYEIIPRLSGAGLITESKEMRDGMMRVVYAITNKGKDAYEDSIR